MSRPRTQGNKTLHFGHGPTVHSFMQRHMNRDALPAQHQFGTLGQSSYRRVAGISVPSEQPYKYCSVLPGQKNEACGVRIAIHGTDAELIVTSCEKCSGLITIRRQCAIFLFYSFTWS